MNKALSVTATVFWLCSVCAGAEQNWSIHEWGTFTSLQDEFGNAIGGINTDDEPVPQFVHRLADFLLLGPTQVPPMFFQGAPSCHPDVTMRLETPVLYFHPPASEQRLSNVNVTVRFRGGWLSEYYPEAKPDAPGLKGPGGFRFGHLRKDTVSSLKWSDLEIGGNWPITNTTAHVWVSPRAVQAALVRTTNGESERFLFYRGVAHIDAPLKISRDDGQLNFRSQSENVPVNRPLTIHSLWLVQVQPDGQLAFRVLPALKLVPDSNTILMRTPASFKPSDFSRDNLQILGASLRQALIAEGLFKDEAQALLNTWQLSYFKNAGLRVFFIVPREWVDYYLPLQVSIPADFNRVMVGRIELVTPEQRAELKELSGFTLQRIEQDRGQLWTNFYGKITYNFSSNKPSRQTMQQMNKELAQVNAGQIKLTSFISVPRSYQIYLDLGRFRNALVLEAAETHSTAGLTNFITAYRLQAYTPVEIPESVNYSGPNFTN